jgi:hypothetical protein
MATTPQYVQAASRASRPNKSHTLIDELKHLAHEEIAIPNPLADLLEKTAQHIEWLELLVTGITGRERKTIAKLTRRVNTLEKMVESRDRKINEHKDVLMVVKREFKLNEKDLKEQHAEKLKEAAIVDQETVHQIERKFIKDLQTGFQKENALSQARWEGQARSTYASGTAASDGGWKQYIQT